MSPAPLVPGLPESARPCLVRVARHAMATRFEAVLHGADPVHLRAAAEEALAEIARIEGRLSLYRPGSDISRINREAGSRPVRVEPRVFQLLEHALHLAAVTGGAFDPTAGPLIHAWGFQGGTGSLPDPARLEAARAATGWQHVVLDSATRTLRFSRPGMALDLGSIGKGHALDQAVGILREEGVPHGLIHGGTSTVCAWGTSPDGSPWQVALADGNGQVPALTHVKGGSPPGGEPAPGAVAHPRKVSLRDESLSVSAPWGRAFRQGNRLLGHVIDPRTGHPVARTALAAVVHPCATDSDALATALLVLGDDGPARIQPHCHGARMWLLDGPDPSAAA